MFVFVCLFVFSKSESQTEFTAEGGLSDAIEAQLPSRMSADSFFSYLECFFNDLGIKTWLNNRFNSERFGSENMF